MPCPEAVNNYIKQIAAKLRAKQADVLRGQPELLDRLEHQTDSELVTRWAWTAFIVGAIATFVGCPIILAILQRWTPMGLFNLLWMFVKMGMGCVVLMFAAALWLTFNAPSEV
jgi:hypothetical protein